MKALCLVLLLPAAALASDGSSDPLTQAARDAKIKPFTPTKTADVPPALAASPTCENVRPWALEQAGFPAAPAALDAASAAATELQSKLVAANRLALPDLCPVAILPSASIEAHNLPVTLEGGRTFKYVALTTAMVKQAADDSQLAFVIGHELGHLAAGLGDVRDEAAFRKRELDADRRGALYMRLAGYEPWEIPGFFAGIAGTDPRYPTSQQRRAALEPSLGFAPASIPKSSSELRDKAIAAIDASQSSR